jgi:hypothetical protein
MPLITRKNRFVCFLPVSSVGEQAEGKKFADLLSIWQPVVKLFSPENRPDTTKIGRGHTGNESIR